MPHTATDTGIEERLTEKFESRKDPDLVPAEQELRGLTGTIAQKRERLRILSDGSREDLIRIAGFEGFESEVGELQGGTVPGLGLGGADINLSGVGGGRESEIRSFIAGKIREEIQGLESQIAGKGELVRTQRLTRLGEREEVTGQELITAAGETSRALDERLHGLLEETGFSAGLGRQEVGAGFAGAGTGRSTFASRGIGRVTLAEQEQKARQRFATSEAQARVEERVSGQFQAITRARRQAELTRSLVDIQTAEDITFGFDAAELQARFKREAFELQLSSEDSGLFGGIVGGILGGLAGFVVSGFNPLGAAAGASAGFGLGKEL